MDGRQKKVKLKHSWYTMMKTLNIKGNKWPIASKIICQIEISWIAKTSWKYLVDNNHILINLINISSLSLGYTVCLWASSRHRESYASSLCASTIKLASASVQVKTYTFQWSVDTPTHHVFMICVFVCSSYTDGIDVWLVASEGLSAHSFSDVPELGWGIAGSRHKQSAVRRQGEAHHVTGVTSKCSCLLTSFNVPQSTEKKKKKVLLTTDIQYRIKSAAIWLQV